MSLSKGKKRFDVSSTNELECASVKFVPKNTTVAINWAFRIFDEWVRHSGEIEGRSYKSEDLWLLRDPEFYAKMMSQFCLEVKQQNGSSYTPKSLLQILINLQKYARSQDPDTFYFMNQKDARFKRVHTVLDNISRQLHKEGVGIDKIQARVVTDMEENHLWETGIIGTHSPTALQNAVFFYCGLLLAKVSSGGCGDRKPLAPANKLVDCTSIDKACENLDIRSKTLSNDKENMDTADQVSGILKHFNFEKMDGCTVNFNFTSK